MNCTQTLPGCDRDTCILVAMSVCMESGEWVHYANEDPLVTWATEALPCRPGVTGQAGQRDGILIGDFHFHCELPLKQKHLQIQGGLHPSLLDPLHI